MKHSCVLCQGGTCQSLRTENPVLPENPPSAANINNFISLTNQNVSVLIVEIK